MRHEEILEGFKRTLGQYTRTAVCGREFVLVAQLQNWLRSCGEGGVTNADRLLRVAYRDRPTSHFQPVTSESFKPGDSCCLLVFCILQLLGCGSAVHTFIIHHKGDQLLPMRRETIADMFQDAEIQDHDMISKFFELQYRFAPAKFQLQTSNMWDENTVMPIYQKFPIKEGGTAQLYQIDTPEECVGETLRRVCAGSRFNAASAESPDWRYQFALKTFKHLSRSLYDNEMNAFVGLKDHEGMVRWLADYRKPQDPSSQNAETGAVPSEHRHETYNILLEYGEMDLGVYFNEVLPPVLQSEIEAFWKSLFAVADAVKGIHHLKVRNAEQIEEYYGWHTDIKPDNILFVETRLSQDSLDAKDLSRLENDQNMFKLADPGFAKFRKRPITEHEDVPKQCLEGGTETYGAPEYPGRSEKPVSQAIDIWSLGCVFSLAATWIVLGHTGVSQFEKVRQLAIEKHVKAQRTSEGKTISEGDQFHNGHSVLGAVTNWHRYLRNVLRKTDTITSAVLDLVDDYMLLGPADRRINARNLCSKLETILKHLPPTSQPQLPEDIKSLLGEVDEEASWKAADIRRSRHKTQASSLSSKTITREDKKSHILERPLKTTHRQSFWPNQSLRLHDGRYPENQGVPLRPVSEQPRTPPQPPQTPQKSSIHLRMDSQSTVHTNSSHSRRARNRTKRTRNYFQACEEIRKWEHEKKWKHSFLKGGMKDPLLKAYFEGSRDIIFLVDNAESMDENWFEATQLLEVLVKLAKGLDSDGMDLRFTTGNITLDGKDSASKFRSSMAAARPKTGSKERARTDLRVSLGTILQDFLGKVREQEQRPKTKVKDVVLLILTDGIWAGMEDKSGVGEQIKLFSNKLKALHYDIKIRPFSFEFIQFGNNDAATQRLRYLDDYLHYEGIPDVIDTEHSSGDVNKMLLGSFVEEYDQAEKPELTAFDSSESEQYLSDHAMSPKSVDSDTGPGLDHLNYGIPRPDTGFSHSRNRSGSFPPANR